ncbi:MAG: hypothetical protein M5R36_04030 [Deltaproteobacteria bacterium]|nr:hypothetical protein [Deltaproteobacteria bacterium]
MTQSPNGIDYDRWIHAQTLAQNAWRATVGGLVGYLLVVGLLFFPLAPPLSFDQAMTGALIARIPATLLLSAAFVLGVLGLRRHPDTANDRDSRIKCFTAVAGLPRLRPPRLGPLAVTKTCT